MQQTLCDRCGGLCAAPYKVKVVWQGTGLYWWDICEACMGRIHELVDDHRSLDAPG